MLAYYIWTSHGESSLSVSGNHENGSSNSSIIDPDNVGLTEAVFDVVGPYFAAPHQSTLYHYDLLRQKDQELYPGSDCDYASSLSTTVRLLNIRKGHNVDQRIFDDFVFLWKMFCQERTSNWIFLWLEEIDEEVTNESRKNTRMSKQVHVV